MTQSTTSGQSTAEQVKERVGETAQAARERSTAAAGQVRGKVSEQVDQRSTQAGQQLASTASDVRSVAEELRKQGKESSARLASQVADRAERFGGYLQSADGDRILRDVENAARQRPWAVVAGGVVLGFAASRFLKASSARRYSSPRHLDTPSTSGRSYDMSADSMPGAATGTVPAGEGFPPSDPYNTREPSAADTTDIFPAESPAAEDPLQAYPTDPGAPGRRGL